MTTTFVRIVEAQSNNGAFIRITAGVGDTILYYRILPVTSSAEYVRAKCRMLQAYVDHDLSFRAKTAV